MCYKTMISEEGLDLLFREARTHSYWQNKDVPDDLLKQVYDLMKFAPTSANVSPARLVFVKSDESKAKLKPHLDGGNVDKTMSAPVCVIIAQDMEFYEHLPKLFPHADARSWFAGKDKAIESTASRNSTLQGAYLMMAARSLGLDCGPMSGFNADGVHDAFFEGQNNIRVNFICNLGYGDPSKLHERLPRFNFEDVSKIV